MTRYGMPYQGAKSSICEELLKQLPDAENFYDLFGGGGSISHAAALSGKYKNAIYNEIDLKVSEFFKDAVDGKYSYENFKPEWVSREEFFSRRDLEGYMAVVWSFGNGGADYLYGKDIEKYKKSMHQAVVFDEFDELAIAALGFSSWPAGVDTITKKRLYLSRKISTYRKTNTLPDSLLPFLSKKQREELQQLERLERLQHLEGLERVSQLEQLKWSTSLAVYSTDYRNIPIAQNSVVYCDIPYEDTRGYSTTFNRSEFLDWAANAPFPVYVSEYSIKDPRFTDIWSVKKRALMCGSTKGKEKAVERLYWNGRT